MPSPGVNWLTRSLCAVEVRFTLLVSVSCNATEGMKCQVCADAALPASAMHPPRNVADLRHRADLTRTIGSRTTRPHNPSRGVDLKLARTIVRIVSIVGADIGGACL